MLRHLWCWLTHWNGHPYETRFTFDDPPFLAYRVCTSCGKQIG